MGKPGRRAENRGKLEDCAGGLLGWGREWACYQWKQTKTGEKTIHRRIFYGGYGEQGDIVPGLDFIIFYWQKWRTLYWWCIGEPEGTKWKSNGKKMYTKRFKLHVTPLIPWEATRILVRTLGVLIVAWAGSLSCLLIVKGKYGRLKRHPGFLWVTVSSRLSQGVLPGYTFRRTLSQTSFLNVWPYHEQLKMDANNPPWQNILLGVHFY